jgi:transcriptional regulator with XRE-family HTH domain
MLGDVIAFRENDCNPGFRELGKVNCAPFSHTARMGRPRTRPVVETNHLRAWREFREMTQEQLAEKVGTKASTISELETGAKAKNGLSGKWLKKLAPALRTTPALLLECDPESLSTTSLELLDAVTDIPPESHAHALEVLRTFRRRA